MNSIRIMLQKNAHQLRQFHKCIPRNQEALAVAVAEKLTIPVPEGTEKPMNPKIDKLAQEITALNLLEVAELSDLLKKRLNLPDAPAMPVGSQFMMAPKVEEEEVAPKVVKSSFTVKLTKFDEKQKVPLIKEIKNLIPGTNLVQAKKFVESLPQVVKADISKEESEQLKEILAKVGGEVIID
ncbi:large ribosomal subunit protein bL12m [Phymastichus coffea]|uniref:large ribosomal subunit protein bL12m n=1 Tax=Phymastichus coffea TaxID=108790 RepID=UPI00273C87C6|nr:large ribosomal subunit protein bL12m [Phymastichus coffea]